ncbi:MAG TPA: ABC transporter permease [Treponemataceae bacterium]|nr:ABC transporter permease [Treponemataceae bacterium]
MTIMEGINEAADSIRHNKLRTFLSLLGMIIGTASVVAVIASGAMMSHEFIDQADSVGARLIVVYNNWELSDYMARPIYMTNKDVEALRLKNRNTLFVRTNNERYKITKGTVSEEGRIYGVDPHYWDMWPRELLAGRTLNQGDEDTLAKVCVLTEDYASQFFPKGDALGSEITIGRFDYTVVGVLKYPEKEALLSDGANRNTVFLSYSVLERTIDWTWFGSPKVFELMIRASSVDAVSSTAKNIEDYLNSTYGKVNDQCRFKIEVIESALKMIRTIFSAVTGVIAFIAGISLLVSGIGIMNVMLMAVTERTREIGIRKAIGARSGDILSQFLIESLFLCLTGGIIGIVLGIGITQIVSLVSKWQYVMPPQAIIIAVLVSAGVGLFFGITPAKSAAALDPVTALARE